MEVEQTNFVTHLIITVQLFIIYSFCFENGVMMIPKRRLLTLIFACLCFKKSSSIKNYIIALSKNPYVKIWSNKFQMVND